MDLLMLCGSSALLSLRLLCLWKSPEQTAIARSMNTVLDDNKKLCLTSGEIISLTPQMRHGFFAGDGLNHF